MADGDTSTSDTLLPVATGAGPAHARIATSGDLRLSDFRAKLDELMIDLACQVVRDGEGASKFVTIDVTGAASDAAARRIGLAIATSPLVKRPAGADANGAICWAVGRGRKGRSRSPEDLHRRGQWRPAVSAVAGYDEAPWPPMKGNGSPSRWMWASAGVARVSGPAI
jgi:glutamate N-acetyltransferase/amino-acid N-acetyltransferase